MQPMGRPGSASGMPAKPLRYRGKAAGMPELSQLSGIQFVEFAVDDGAREKLGRFLGSLGFRRAGGDHEGDRAQPGLRRCRDRRRDPGRRRFCPRHLSPLRARRHPCRPLQARSQRDQRTRLHRWHGGQPGRHRGGCDGDGGVAFPAEVAPPCSRRHAGRRRRRRRRPRSSPPLRQDAVLVPAMWNMRLRQLSSFVLGANLKRIGRASAHLDIAAPAISRSISALEEELSAALFRRDGPGHAPVRGDAAGLQRQPQDARHHLSHPLSCNSAGLRCARDVGLRDLPLSCPCGPRRNARTHRGKAQRGGHRGSEAAHDLQGPDTQPRLPSRTGEVMGRRSQRS